MLTNKQVGRNAGNSGRINGPGSEPDTLGPDTGDAVTVEIADATAVAHALIDSPDSDDLLSVPLA